MVVQHFRNVIAMILKHGPPTDQNVKTYLIIALSDSETKGREIGTCRVFLLQCVSPYRGVTV